MRQTQLRMSEENIIRKNEKNSGKKSTNIGISRIFSVTVNEACYMARLHNMQLQVKNKLIIIWPLD